MANLPIASAAALTGAQTASGDLFPLLDVSAAAGSQGSKITRDELGDAMTRTAAVIAALGGKAATSHSHSAATTGADGFMSSADKTKLDGLSSPTTPGVIYVTSSGNDTTGDGSFSKPYLTAQKAYDMAFAATGANRLIQLGAGTYTITAVSWPKRIQIAGAGRWLTSLTINLSEDSELWGDRSLKVNIAGLPLSLGMTGPTIVAYGLIGDSCTSTGTQGQTGSAGFPGDESSIGGPGGTGGTGGTGGSISLIGCAYATVTSTGGEGGLGGPGGVDGGMGGGAEGDAGTAGTRGTVALYRSDVGELTCALYDWANSNIETVTEGTIANDEGANTNAAYPY